MEDAVESAYDKAAEATSLTDELVTLRSEVARLELNNECLLGSIASLQEAAGLRQRHREKELQDLHESLLSKQVGSLL